MEQTRLQWKCKEKSTRAASSKELDKHMQADLADRVALLQSLPLFEGLAEEALYQLAKESRQRKFKVGEII